MGLCFWDSQLYHYRWRALIFVWSCQAEYRRLSFTGSQSLNIFRPRFDAQLSRSRNRAWLNWVAIHCARRSRFWNLWGYHLVWSRPSQLRRHGHDFVHSGRLPTRWLPGEASFHDEGRAWLFSWGLVIHWSLRNALNSSVLPNFRRVSWGARTWLGFDSSKGPWRRCTDWLDHWRAEIEH